MYAAHVALGMSLLVVELLVLGRLKCLLEMSWYIDVTYYIGATYAHLPLARVLNQCWTPTLDISRDDAMCYSS
jgi:hypothetical protein